MLQIGRYPIKIRLAKAAGFDNISIFHFGGLIANGYQLADTLTVK